MGKSKSAEEMYSRIGDIDRDLKVLERQKGNCRGKDWREGIEVSNRISRFITERNELLLRLTDNAQTFWECLAITNVNQHPWETYEKLLVLADREGNFLYSQVVYEKVEYLHPFGTREEKAAFNAWIAVIDKTDFGCCLYGRQYISGYHPRMINNNADFITTIQNVLMSGKKAFLNIPEAASAKLVKQRRFEEATYVRHQKRDDRIQEAIKGLKTSRPNSERYDGFRKMLTSYGYDPTIIMTETEKLWRVGHR